MAKRKATARRKTVRRAATRSRVGTPSTPPNRNPKFEAVSLTVDASTRESPASVAERVAKVARVGGWRVEEVSAERGQFELVPPKKARRLTPGAAWDIVYRLREQPEVVYAEPLFEYEVADLHKRPAARKSAGGSSDDPRTAGDFEWSLRKAN